MLRKVAIAVGVLVVLVAARWGLRSSPASSEDCTFEPAPRASFEANRLELSFSGRVTGDLLYEARARLFDMIADDTGCGLSAELSFEPPLEAGTFTIEGEAERTASGWTFKPSASNHLKIKSAVVSAGHSFAAAAPASQRLQVSGTLTVDRATEQELTGRLQLRSEGPGAGQVSTRFTAVPARKRL